MERNEHVSKEKVMIEQGFTLLMMAATAPAFPRIGLKFSSCERLTSVASHTELFCDPHNSTRRAKPLPSPP